MSERYQFDISFSFSMQVSTPKDWELDKKPVSLYELMTNEEELSDFINFDLFKEEKYWDISKKKIDLFNSIVRNKGQPQKKRRGKMVASALAYGDQIYFLNEQPVNKIMEISKLIAVGISARTSAQISTSLQDKLRKYILPELEVRIKNLKFLIIPCFSLWDSGNKHKAHRKTQFITINLIFLPHNIKSDHIYIEQMYKFITEISQPKLYGNHVDVLNTIKFQDFKIERNEYPFIKFLDELAKGICRLFQAEKDATDYFQNQMMSLICHFSLENESCYVPNFSVLRKYNNQEKIICKLLSSFLYSFFWMENNPIKSKDSSIYDYILNLSQDIILHQPHNVAAFFTEKRRLTLVAMHEADSFPDYSSIWTTGSELLIHEIFSIQLYLISYYTERLREVHDKRNIFKLKDIMKDQILDFEPLYNMETDDFDLNHRISRMQSKMGIQPKYKVLNQNINSLSTLVTEKENKNLQLNVIVLSIIVIIIGVFSLPNIDLFDRIKFIVIGIPIYIMSTKIIWNRDQIKQYFNEKLNDDAQRKIIC